MSKKVNSSEVKKLIKSLAKLEGLGACSKEYRKTSKIGYRSRAIAAIAKREGYDYKNAVSAFAGQSNDDVKNYVKRYKIKVSDKRKKKSKPKKK